MKAAKVISSTIDGTKRMCIKVLRLGKSDVQISKQIAPYGIDSSPIKDMVAIHSDTSEKGKTVVIGYINKESITESGETRLFSTDENGVLKSTVYLKNDDTLELMGNSDYAMKYNKFQEQMDIIIKDLNIVMAAAGLPATLADFSTSKNPKIKTN